MRGMHCGVESEGLHHSFQEHTQNLYNFRSVSLSLSPSLVFDSPIMHEKVYHKSYSKHLSRNMYPNQAKGRTAKEPYITGGLVPRPLQVLKYYVQKFSASIHLHLYMHLSHLRQTNKCYMHVTHTHIHRTIMIISHLS